MIELFESPSRLRQPRRVVPCGDYHGRQGKHSKRVQCSNAGGQNSFVAKLGPLDVCVPCAEGQASAITTSWASRWTTSKNGAPRRKAWLNPPLQRRRRLTRTSPRTTGLRGSNVFYADAQEGDGPSRASNADRRVQGSQRVGCVAQRRRRRNPAVGGLKRLQGAPFLKGAAFYQLTKTEARVQDGKLIVIRDKALGKVYSGDAARQLLNIPVRSPKGYVRLHPDATPQFDIFIQSTSINRKLVAVRKCCTGLRRVRAFRLRTSRGWRTDKRSRATR
jgi:hypothetical protein